jgi:hypothetical protein
VTIRPEDNLDLIRRVLGKEFLDLDLKRLHVEEEPDVQTRVVVVASDDGRTFEVDGAGVGLVDAIYAGLLGRFAIEYQSLKSIRLVGFRVEANLDSKKGQAGVDAEGTVTIEVLNSEGKRFRFADSSRSVTASTARAVLAVVEYFVNAERAFITLFNARKDATERNRMDLVARYTAELAEVVRSTSYAEVIEGMRKQIG